MHKPFTRMKKIFLFIVLSFQICFCMAQSSEEIIEAHIKAIGGEQKWDSIQTIAIASTIHTKTSNLVCLKQVIKNNCIRNDIAISSKEADAKPAKKYYVLITPNGAWNYLPDNKANAVLPLDSLETITYLDELDYEDPFLHYTDKNRIITMQEIVYENNVSYNTFSIAYPSGKTEIIFLDSETNLMAKRIILGDPDVTIEYHDYEFLPQGILWPKFVTASYGTIVFDKIGINENMDMNIFKPSPIAHANKFNEVR